MAMILTKARTAVQSSHHRLAAVIRRVMMRKTTERADSIKQNVSTEIIVI